LSIGQLVAAELIVAVVVGGLAKFGKHIESFYDLMASVDKLGVLFDLPIERTDGLLTTGQTSGIVTKNISYSLHDGREILNNVSLSIRSGQKVAISGASGCGKSLLLDMLFGLRVPDSGLVIVNGIDPRDVRPDMLRKRVTLARDIEVFEGTIAENVHLERPDIKFSDVRTALEIVNLLPSIQQHPLGLETKLTSAGTPLTTSQLRRLMVARAIVGAPEIVLLDEILDGMSDAGSAQILQHMIDAEFPRTIVLVTNREKLKSMMDNVIEL
jgi:ABC-type bacteriocin/lantibiotic exporter with double-glycine peptidase domain